MRKPALQKNDAPKQPPIYPCDTCSSNYMNKNGGDCGAEESGCDELDKYYNQLREFYYPQKTK